MKTVTLVSLALTCFAVAGGASYAGLVYSAKVKLPPIQNQQSIDEAMAQANTLLAELRSNGWNRGAVNQALLRLPDQDLAESELKRRPGRPSFLIQDTSHPLYGNDVAFYASTYVRLNVAADPSAIEHQSSQPSGFYIVGYRQDGVVKVQFEDVRYKQMSMYGGKPTFMLVFPGMDEYATAVTRESILNPSGKKPAK